MPINCIINALPGANPAACEFTTEAPALYVEG
jgi:hypothetical protein